MKTFSFPFTRIWIACMLASTIGFTGCKKELEGTGDTNAAAYARAASLSDAEADWIFDDLFNNVLGVNKEVGPGGTGIFGRADTNCFTLTITQLKPNTRFPLQISIDFGKSCAGADGRLRKGRIEIIYTGNLSNIGSASTTSFIGYSIDDINVEDILQISNTSSTTRRSYTAIVTNARLGKGQHDFILWNSEKTVSQTEGLNTLLINLDDVFELTGQSSGAAQTNGLYFQWTAVTTAPLVKRFTCPWIAKGVISLRKNGAEVAALDYGSGSCDNKASFILNGVGQEITLH